MKLFLRSWGLIVLVLLFIGGSYFTTSFYPDILWFGSLNLSSVWWFVFKSKLTVFFAGFLASFIFLFLNFLWAKKASSYEDTAYSFNTPFSKLNKFLSEFRIQSMQSPLFRLPARLYGVALYAAIGTISIFFGLIARSWWFEIYAFLNQVPFGKQDPIFNKDISFYLFSLPVIQNIQSWGISLVWITLAFVIWIYFSKNIMLALFTTLKVGQRIKSHIFVLLFFLFALLGVGAWVNMYELLFSARGVVFGAGFTDHHILLPVYKILASLWFVAALTTLVWSMKKGFKVPASILSVVVIVSIVGLNFLPGIIQNFIVAPNEMVKEKKYIKNNIEFTRLAYGLDRIQEKKFPAKSNLTMQDIQKNDTTVKNILLWNPEPLKQTFSQLQEIRLYYEFGNIDIDRYLINGKLEQVMLSPREMNISELSSQAQTWLNKHLVYTHGYGLCMSPVSQISDEGLPKFYMKDLPTKSSIDLQLTRPEIYFGENTLNYILVNTKQKEFNYPKGDTNVYTNYQGKGGVQLDSPVKRLIYALKFSEMKIFISSLVQSASRIIYDRDIYTITRKIAPFLAYDQDPYLVVTDTGRMVWMYDAYTISKYFPYSEPYNQVNYIRNAVKVTIDAYNGEINYYVADQTDPLIAAYAKMYGDLFKDLKEMPTDIKNHMRYPRDMFSVQSSLFSTYHMTDPQVFYNREDLWELPSETYGEAEQLMKPYYMVTKLPGEKKESFILMTPFTPTNKNNMIAWMNVKCDPDNYGELQVFKFPKEKTIYGPMQIESRIDQDTDISQKLTLWGQVGSRVIRGNIMVVPIEESLVYVEPIYLQATQSKLPELKRVIFAYEDRIVMSNTLQDSVQYLFEGYSGSIENERRNPKVEKSYGTSSLERLIEAISKLKDETAEKFQNIERIIDQLKKEK